MEKRRRSIPGATKRNHSQDAVQRRRSYTAKNSNSEAIANSGKETT